MSKFMREKIIYRERDKKLEVILTIEILTL